MCGKYYINHYTSELLGTIVEDYDELQDNNITPGMNINIVIANNKKIVSHTMKWGYSMSLNSSLVINARSETIFEKRMFKDDILKRRCLIPASGFYEWDHLKHQISFENDDDILWMAGIYNKYGEVVIITTQANDVMQPIHSRMPLILHHSDIVKWFDDECYKDVLTSLNNDLKIVSGNIQQSLF